MEERRVLKEAQATRLTQALQPKPSTIVRAAKEPKEPKDAAAAKEKPAAPPPPPNPLEELKKDVQLQKALEVLKTVQASSGPQAMALRGRFPPAVA